MLVTSVLTISTLDPQPKKSLMRSVVGFQSYNFGVISATHCYVTSNVWEVEATIQIHKTIQLLVRLGDGSLYWNSE